MRVLLNKVTTIVCKTRQHKCCDFVRNFQEDMLEERQEYMVPPTNDGIPTCRKSYFLKPTLNSSNLPLPKPPSLAIPQPSDPDITKMMAKRVLYQGRLKPLVSWDKWVEILQKTHQETWKKAGIFEAIKASTYNILRHNEMIINLAERWCSDTNTFIFSWGESTITLEDVMILGGFSVLGNSVQSALQRTENEDVEIKLTGLWREIGKMHCSFHVSQSKWMEYFKGSGGEMEHVAFLVLWLSRYVLTTNSYSIITRNVFPVAIDLARGTRIAFAPVVLASIYRDLTLLRNRIVTLCEERQDDGSKLVLWAPFQLVQIWAWERFWALVPKPVCLLPGEPRLARWHNIPKLESKILKLEMECAGDWFLWRPYVMKLKNWDVPEFYYYDQELCVLPNSEVGEELLSFVRCLGVCELVGVDCVEQYLPHRVGLQFGMDQDIPISIPRLNADADLAWSFYQKPLDGVQFLYIPPRLREGDVTVRYSNWRTRITGSSFCNEALIVCKRQRRTPRKTKKLSDVSCDMREGSKQSYPTWLSLLCNELMGLAIAESSMDNPVDESLPCKSASERHIPLWGEKEKEVNNSSLNLSELKGNLDSTCSYNEASIKLDGAKITVVSEMSILCCLPAGDGQGKAVDQDTELTKVSVLLHDQKQGYEKNVPVCSFLNCDNEAICFPHPAQDGRQDPNEMSFLCKEVSPREGPLALASDIGKVKAIELSEHTPTTEHRSKDLIARSLKRGVGSKYVQATDSENETTADVTAGIIEVAPEMNTLLCLSRAEDEQGEKQDVDITQQNNLAHSNTIVISDDDSDDLHHFLAQCVEYESMISKLEQETSVLQAAIGSTVR